MKRILIKETQKKIGESVRVAGWVQVRRDHGKLIFIDLRDISGVLQCVFTLPSEASAKEGSSHKNTYKLAQTLRTEWVVELIGIINKRPEKMVNPEIETGQVEMEVKEAKVLAQSKTPPFEITTDGYEVSEEVRMKYRYLDLRRERLKNNLIARHKAVKFIRDYLTDKGFIEVETPMLTKSTPEGARDFLVPSRQQPGKFYALPQSPQQYKQLLMASGIEKYFQIAKALRDEDPRGDRQAEHTQADLEISFAKKEDVMDLVENLLTSLVKELFPDKKIQDTPFPRISYKESMEKYQTDRPDLRENKEDKNLLAFGWVIDFPFFEKTDKGKWTFTHNPFSAPKEEFTDDLLAGKNIENILTSQYDVFLNGLEIGGGSIRNHKPEALEKVFEIMGYKKSEIKEKFGHMLEAFSLGMPPHGGIALGLDRIISLLQGEPNIREVIAFPKTGDGRDLMMQAPSDVSKEQLKELCLKIEAKKPSKKK